MTLISTQGSSLEGRILRLVSRKPVTTTTPVKLEPFGMTYPFRLQQNSEAQIQEESNPKTFRFDKTASMNLGDMIRAVAISGFSTKPLPPCKLIQATGNHKGSETKCKDFGYAKIDIPLRTVLERIAKLGQTSATTQPVASLLAAKPKQG